MDPSPAPKALRPRRVVEESLGDVLTSSIDAFVFRDIEDEAAATAVFAFVDDEDVRATLGQALRGARWMQKAGLALARPPGHPARPTLLRSQLIDYGAIIERCLREAIRQHRPTGVPSTFQGLIQRAGETELLSQRAINAADRRREARNRVHLDVDATPLTGTESAKALKDTALIINELRARAGLGPWHPKRPEPRP